MKNKDIYTEVERYHPAEALQLHPTVYGVVMSLAHVATLVVLIRWF